MNGIDFSFPGGFPLDADGLDFNQKSLAEVLKWPAILDDGTYHPLMILSGVVDDGGDQFSDGWLLYNGEVLEFKTTSAAGVNQWKLYLVETRTPAVFQNGSTHNVYMTRWAELGGSQGVQIANDVRALPRLESIIGARAAAQGIGYSTQIAIGSHGLFKVGFTLNPLTRLVHLGGEMNVLNAQTLPTPAARSFVLTLPAAFKPGGTVVFAALHDYNNSTDDPTLRSITCRIHQQNPPDYDLSVALVKPSDPTIASYMLRFHHVYQIA